MKSSTTISSSDANTERYLGFESTNSDDFFFISYNSEDCRRISSYAQQIYNSGIPLWYDKGIEGGTRWEQEIGRRIANSKAIIFFFTKGILEKDESYAEKEFRIAKNLDKKIYIFFFDKFNNSYYKQFPHKSSFLDDVSQKQSYERINDFIACLKKHNQPSTPTSNSVSSKKILPFSVEPTIVTSESLLNGGYFTAKELSQRHVELDRLTVDENLFPDALNIEGDADTWESMVVDTADCTANLIINNEIVGYMDFIPVSPENYDLLKTEPFSDKYVAFYSFGGKFDIYISMFSIDMDHSLGNNYKLFFQWIINRILDLCDAGISINRIAFSIYSRTQASALRALGCKLILHNKLKGFLFETRAKDLLNNQTLINNIIRKRICTYNTYTNSDKYIVSECKEIVEPLLAKNGGILIYEDAVCDSDIIITATLQEKTVGFVCLKNYDVFPDGIYIEQIAVMEKYQGLGIGEHLLNNAIQYAIANKYNIIYANCQQKNVVSQSLLNKKGFVKFDMAKEQYLGIGIDLKDIDNNYAYRYAIN